MTKSSPPCTTRREFRQREAKVCVSPFRAQVRPKETIMSEPRQAEFPIEKFFLERWSPRSFEPVDMPDADLMNLFEAARWAPSSFNNQPWRFLYAKRGSEAWPRFMALMVAFNQTWTKNASVLVVVLSNTQFDHNGTPSA